MIAAILYVMSAAIAIASLAIVGRVLLRPKQIPISLVIIFYFGVFEVLFGLLFLCGVGFSLLLGCLTNILIIAIMLFLVFREVSPNGAFEVETVKALLRSQFTMKKLAFRGLFYLIAIIAIGVYAYVRFGFPCRIVFLTSDPAYHFEQAKLIAEGSPVIGQIGSWLIDGIVMSSITPFIGNQNIYSAFIISETLLFILSAVLFFSTICTIGPNHPIVSWIVSLLYISSIPLLNYNYGFSYLSFSITLINALLCILVLFDGKSKRAPYLICIAILCYMLIISYCLFVPAIYLGVALSVGRVLWKNAGYTLPRVVLTLFAVFFFAMIMGYVMVYSVYFVSSDNSNVVTSDIGTAIARGGGSLNLFYATALFFLPISIYGLVQSIVNTKTKNGNQAYLSLDIPCCIFILFYIVALVLAIKSIVSPYYLSKIYAVLWLFGFVYLYIGSCYLSGRVKSFLISYTLIWAILFFGAVTGFDGYLAEKRPRINTQPIAKDLFYIYAYNIESMHKKETGIDVAAYQGMLDEAGISDEEALPIIDEERSLRWYHANDTNLEIIYYWLMTKGEFSQCLENYDYLVLGKQQSALKLQSGETTDDIVTEILNSNEVIGETSDLYLLKLDKHA